MNLARTKNNSSAQWLNARNGKPNYMKIYENLHLLSIVHDLPRRAFGWALLLPFVISSSIDALNNAKNTRHSLDFSKFIDAVLAMEKDRFHVYCNILECGPKFSRWCLLQEPPIIFLSREWNQLKLRKCCWSLNILRLENQSIKLTKHFYWTSRKSTWWQSSLKNVRDTWSLV